MGAYSPAGWERAIECNRNIPGSIPRSVLESILGSVLGSKQ
jgi:hypothetical protein